jgi:hypothetical protein
MVAVAAAGCAKEPPSEAERMSLKDSWLNVTTVAQADPPVPVTTVYTPPPPPPEVRRVRPAPASPARTERAIEPPPAPPTLALSPPKADPPLPVAKPASPVPVPAPPQPLAEGDLAAGSIRCGPGLDCVAVLRGMIDDPKQSWMMRAPTPAEFANGTRLFAYRALKTTLDCGKLRFANAELDWAIDTFSSSRLEGVDAAHRARVTALAEAVHAEIEGEIKKRC